VLPPHKPNIAPKLKRVQLYPYSPSAIVACHRVNFRFYLFIIFTHTALYSDCAMIVNMNYCKSDFLACVSTQCNAVGALSCMCELRYSGLWTASADLTLVKLVLLSLAST
jgi:hypothetical protein